ncbi:hypothetical protein SeMB42_g02257 [Synchytrium endobioticum]|nr:hypothetical protein SeMB42_g02257 [Synchytrium endobioticum]
MVTMSLLTYIAVVSLQGNVCMPIVVFIGNMGYLIWNFFSSQILSQDSSTFDQTIPLMILTIKLTSIGWAIHDGTMPEDSLLPEQKVSAVKTIPGPLEFMGYLLWFPSFMVGPAIQSQEYHAFIHRLPPFDRIPNTIIPALQKLAVATIYMSVYLACASRASYVYCTTDEFANSSLVYKFTYIFFAGIITRTKYYTAWSLSDGASTLTGFGYSGYNGDTGRHEWTRARNVDVLGLELASNVRGLLESWNIKTALWLRHAVYLRLRAIHPTQSGGIATLATFITSACWHGFHVGYYLTFASGALLTSSARLVRRNVRPLVCASRYKPLYDVAGWLASVLATDYIVMPFVLFKFSDSVKAWRAFYFIPHVVMLGIVVSFKYLGAGRCVAMLGRRLGVATEPLDAGAAAKKVLGKIVVDRTEVVHERVGDRNGQSITQRSNGHVTSSVVADLAAEPTATNSGSESSNSIR